MTFQKVRDVLGAIAIVLAVVGLLLVSIICLPFGFNKKGVNHGTSASRL